MKIVAKTIAFAFAALLAGCASLRKGGNPDGFVMLAEAVPDAILGPRYYSTYNFIGDRVDGYEEPCAILTKEAAASLKAASDETVRKPNASARNHDRSRIQAACGRMVALHAERRAISRHILRLHRETAVTEIYHNNFGWRLEQ